MSDRATQTQPAAPGDPPLRHSSFARVILSWRRWWRNSVLGTVDQQKVIEERREDAYISPRYLFMTAMSGGIAILGMLLASPAVVIGAMLLSPLMGPIIGLGFALATGDYQWLRQSAWALVAGCLLAVLLCALIVFVSPLQTVTPEIASRTRPNLFDLLVALFSALAGAYAMIRGREGTIVGVAIATALMPPLAAIGFGMATLNSTVFWGALLLFVTNLLTIALTAWGMARLYGFSARLTGRQTMLQNFVLIGVFVGLAVPLGYQLLQIAWEATAARQIRAELEDVFGSSARLSQPEIAFDTDPLLVTAFVWTTSLQPEAEKRAEANMARRLGRPVDFDLKQFLVQDEKSAEQAQLAQARVKEEQAASQRAASIAQRLALAAGVAEDDVLVDRQRRHAIVRAKRLPGAQLATYQALERRIAQTEPEWRVELIPPPSALSPIEFETKPSEEGEGGALATTPAGTAALQTVRWAALRINAPLVLSGPRELVAIARKDLEKAGIAVRDGNLTAAGTTVTPAWGELYEE